MVLVEGMIDYRTLVGYLARTDSSFEEVEGQEPQ